MHKFKIKCVYKTGSTFGSSEEEIILPFIWDSIEKAKENLLRIKEHYEYYEANNNAFLTKKKDLIKNAPTKSWFYKPYDGCLILLNNDGHEEVFSPQWCGYFETLYEAEIIEDTSDRKISFR